MAAQDVKQLSAKQLAMARKVFDIAKFYVDKDPDVVEGTLTAVNDESTFVNYGNDGTYAGQKKIEVWSWYGGQTTYRAHMSLTRLMEPDAMAGGAETTKDSVGLFQQREMYGYGGNGNKPTTLALTRLMQPEWSVRVFIEGVPAKPTVVKHWLDPRMPKGLTLPQKIQWVQGSEFLDGNNYAESRKVAQQLIEKFGGLPVSKPAKPKDWLETLMAEDQATLDAQWDRIADKVVARLSTNAAFFETLSVNFLLHGLRDQNFRDTLLRAADDSSNALRLIKGGYTGDTLNDSNIAGIWKMLKEIQSKLGVEEPTA